MNDLVSSGYTHSDIGTLPDNWSVRPLSEIVSVMTNGFVGTATSAYVENDDGVTYIQGFNVEPNGFNLTNIRKVSQDFHKSHTKSCLRTGDVLTIQTGDIGVSTVVPEYLSGSNCHALIISRFIKNLAHPAYYCQYFNSKMGMNAFKEIETGTTMKHLNVGDMLQLLVPVPPIAEQQAIAETLLDMDTLISRLDQLIAKKRDIQQAAMQQLLTGQRRLPGFSGEWYIKKLGELAFFLKGAALSKNDLTPDGSKKCILYGELFTTYGREIREIYSRTNANSGTPSKLGDVLLPGSTTTSGIDLASAAAVLEDNVLLGGDINIIRPNSKESFDPVFLSQYLTNVAANDIAERAQGITIIHLYGRDLRSLSIKLPTIHEQSAIATTLSVIDNELAALEARRDKAQLLKQGMMQELLSGRIRLTDSSL